MGTSEGKYKAKHALENLENCYIFLAFGSPPLKKMDLLLHSKQAELSVFVHEISDIRSYSTLQEVAFFVILLHISPEFPYNLME